MKKFPQIINELYYRPLIVTQQRHAAMCRVLESRMAAQDIPMQPDMPDEPTEPDWETDGAVAVIPVHGVLVKHASDIPRSTCGCGCDTVGAMIDLAVADSGVETIVLDFRTPGGAVTGIPELAGKIARISDKRTVAFTDSECCSAGVWLASQCEAFYTSPSASVGSVGVWCAYLDLSRQMAMSGENLQEISSGKFKTAGAWWKPLTAEERNAIQADCDKIHGQFKAAVNSRRAVADEFLQGQVFDGEKAVEIGLCDGLLDDISELFDSEE